MALPARYTLSAWRGSTFRKLLTVFDGPGAPQDLTDFAAEMVIVVPGQTEPEYTLTSDAGQITLGGTTGTVGLHIPAEDLDPLVSGVYELTLIDPDGEPDTILWGGFHVRGLT